MGNLFDNVMKELLSALRRRVFRFHFHEMVHSVLVVLSLLGIINELPVTTATRDDVLVPEMLLRTPTIRSRRRASGIVTHRGQYLHEIESSFLVDFSLRNVGNRTRHVSIHRTPFSTSELTYNLIAPSNDFFHTGIVAEETGYGFERAIALRPGETLTNEIDFSLTTQVTSDAVESGVAKLLVEFDLNVVEDDAVGSTGSTRRIKMQTNVAIERGAGIPIFDHRRRMDVYDTDSSFYGTGAEVRLTNETDTYQNVPYWHAVCGDFPDSMTGYVYPPDNSSAPCSALTSYCDAQLETVCPLTCGKCKDRLDIFVKPYEERSFVTDGHCTTEQMSLIAQAEQTKMSMCSTLLYCTEKRTTECEAAVERWFGGASANQTNWEVLRSGYARICSVTNYTYNCDPEHTHVCTYSLPLIMTNHLLIQIQPTASVTGVINFNYVGSENTYDIADEYLQSDIPTVDQNGYI